MITGVIELFNDGLKDAAIMVLLGVLIGINALAVYLRKKFERRW